MKLLITVLFFIATACVSCQTSAVDYSGRYRSEDGFSTIDLIHSKEGLRGHHCINIDEGTLIDCCLDDFSIELNLSSSGEMTGTFLSCYDDLEHKILVSIDSKGLIMKILDEHGFLVKDEKIRFLKDESTR